VPGVRRGPGLVGVGPDMDIDRHAPAIAEVERIIRTPIETLWNLLVDIDGWPRWNRHITSAHLRGPVGVGGRFDWEAEGLKMTSAIGDFEPMRRIAWTGTASGIATRQVWTFMPRSAQVTLVRTEESWDGDTVRADAAALGAALEGSLQA